MCLKEFHYLHIMASRFDLWVSLSDHDLEPISNSKVHLFALVCLHSCLPLPVRAVGFFNCQIAGDDKDIML